jgi:hypothetical protein
MVHTKHVHIRLRARLGSAEVESGTAIHFNAKQLIRQMQTTRNTGICKWLQQLGATTPLLAAAEDAEIVRIDDDDDDDGMDIDDEFNHLNLTGGPAMIADEDLFVLAEEEEDLNILMVVPMPSLNVMIATGILGAFCSSASMTSDYASETCTLYSKYTTNRRLCNTMIIYLEIEG